MKGFHSLPDAVQYLLFRHGKIFRPKRNLAGRIHVKKLRAWILKDRADLSRLVFHAAALYVAAVFPYAALNFAAIELRYQPVQKPKECGFSASGRSGNEDALSISHGQGQSLRLFCSGVAS